MSSSHDRVRLRDRRVFEMLGMRDGSLDATDSRNRGIRIINAPSVIGADTSSEKLLARQASSMMTHSVSLLYGSEHH